MALTKTGLLLVLLAAFSSVVAASKPSSCNPHVCDCDAQLTTANCTSRGFLTMPSGLPDGLSHLHLSGNDLETVNTTELSRLRELVTLDLSDNRLTELALVSVHYRLELLDLSRNNISSVRSLHLKGLVSLEELRLGHNKIMNLPPNAFAGSPLLRTLDLRSNRIVSLEPGSLDQLKMLEELVLSKNKLSTIPKGLFAHLKNLVTLELNKNNFIEIVGLSFHGLDNLRVLKLKRNQIEYLTDGAFFGLSNIEELHLDRNRVNSVEKGWLYGVTTLRVLSLAHNRVDYISDDGWEFCHSLEELDLRSNRMQLLDRDSLRMLPQLRTLLLQDNLISHIQDDDAFAETPRLETLALDGNEISHTVEDMEAPFRGLRNLRKLSLCRNQIKSVGERAFRGRLESLEEIDLQDNLISTVQENAFAGLSSLHTLRINSGSMLCDCYLKWLPKWANETGVQGCDAATCAHPIDLKGQSIMRVPYEEFTCDDFPKPYILQQPETQITLRGSNLTLYCRAASTSPAEMTFEWKLDSEMVEYGRCSPEDSRDRCIHDVAHSFDGKGREITSELRLSNLEYDDAGKYQCVVSNRFGVTYSDRANITVYVYPQFVVTPEDVTVQGGRTAALKCAASGVPAPVVSWNKDSGNDFPAARENRIAINNFSAGEEHLTNVNSFVIYSVKARDMGIYQCVASNPAGTISWNITLSVLEVPKFVKPMESKTVAEGETAVIECLASGSPKPRLSWTKDGGKLEATERHFFTADNQLLIIVKAMPSDSGRYECSMHNQLGTESQASQLEVVDPSTIIVPKSNKTVPTNVGIGPPGEDEDDDGNGGGVFSMAALKENWVLLLIAIIGLVALVFLIWAGVFWRAKYYRRQRAASGDAAVAAGSRRVSGASSSHDVEFKFGQGKKRNSSGGGGGSGRGGGDSGFSRAPNAMTLGSAPGEGEFDIHAHVSQALLQSKMANSEKTRRDPESGVLSTDFKKQQHQGMNGILVTKSGGGSIVDIFDERDSGTGDSKKSSDQDYEEGIPLMQEMSPSVAVPPPVSIMPPRLTGGRRRAPSPPSTPDPGAGEGEAAASEAFVQRGGGESRMSLSEMADVKDSGFQYCDDDSNSELASLPSDGMDVQGGGEGECDVEDDTVSSESGKDASSSKVESSRVDSPDGCKSNPEQSKKDADGVRIENEFRTFHPRGRRQRQISEVVNGVDSDGTAMISTAAKDKRMPSRRAGSTVELNGKCYLAIDPAPKSGSVVPEAQMEPAVYRGGAGTLPFKRDGLKYQQELLEASLNSSIGDDGCGRRGYKSGDTPPLPPRLKKTESRNSLFGRRRNPSGRRRRGDSVGPSEAAGVKEPRRFRNHSATRVVDTEKEMF